MAPKHGRSSRFMPGLLTLAMCCAAAHAQSAAAHRARTADPMTFGSPGPTSHLFGSWGGVRTSLKQKGIRLGASYVGELASNLAGGKRQGTLYAQQIAVKAVLDWGKLAGLSGFSTHFELVNRAGHSTSAELLGDNLLHVQQIYGGGGGVVAHLVYAYAQEKSPGGSLKIKAGRLPVMTDFGGLKPGCDFMSLTICANRGLDANLGWTVSPRATWGASAFFKLAKNVKLGTGLYEVNPRTGGRSGFDWSLTDTTGVIVPVELDFKARVGGRKGLYKIGAYYDTSRFPEWDTALNGAPLYLTSLPAARTGRAGAYVLAQQPVSKHMTVLAGYDFNGDHTSLFEHFAFVGLLDKGLIPARPRDRVGLSYAYARVSTNLTHLQRGQAALGLPLANGAPGVQTDEMLIELNYDIAAFRGVRLMPDLQYVMRPDGTDAYPNAFVAGLQVRIKF